MTEVAKQIEPDITEGSSRAVAPMARQSDHLPADPMVSMIERVVMNPNADLDKLERMLAMKERMDAQSAKVAFARALSAARTTIPPIIKDATVNYKNKDGKTTHYQHETLAGIAKVIDPILADHGLSYRYRTEQGQGGVRVTCIIQHSDGHSEETSLSGSPDGSGSKNAFQAVGSAVTYLQRYTLKAALGLSAEVDDDAQGAAPRDPQPRQSKPEMPAAPKPEAVADEMIAAIRGADTEARLKGIWTSNKFRADLAWLRGQSPEKAAHVEAAKDSRKECLKPQANHDLDDEIPEFEGSLK